MRGLMLGVLLACGALLGGCCQTEPNYRLEDVAFDPGLLGRWEQVEPPSKEAGEAPMTLDIQERDLEVRAGRVQAPWQGVQPSTARVTSVHPARAYRLTFHPPTSNDPDLVFNAFLLEHPGRRFIGMQLSPEGVQGAALTDFALPVHFLMFCDRTDNLVTLRAPRTPVVWIPLVRPIDPPARDAPDVPTTSQITDGAGVPFTSDPDRLVRIYAAHANDHAFWEETPRVYRRISEQSAPTGR